MKEKKERELWKHTQAQTHMERDRRGDTSGGTKYKTVYLEKRPTTLTRLQAWFYTTKLGQEPFRLRTKVAYECECGPYST